MMRFRNISAEIGLTSSRVRPGSLAERDIVSLLQGAPPNGTPGTVRRPDSGACAHVPRVTPRCLDIETVLRVLI